MQFLQLLQSNPYLLAAFAIWTLPWKGYALWKAAKNGDKKWFVAILILNTMAILDITYIFFFSKKHGKPRKLNTK